MSFGVEPAMIGAKMFLEGKWTAKGVHTCEEFDPDPFMDELNKRGLPWKEDFGQGQGGAKQTSRHTSCPKHCVPKSER